MRKNKKTQERIEKYYKEEFSNSNVLIKVMYNSIISMYTVWVIDSYWQHIESVFAVSDIDYKKIKEKY